MASGTIKTNKWSSETAVTMTYGTAYFSHSIDGLLKKVRFKNTTEPTTEVTYSALIPSEYMPTHTTLGMAYDNNGMPRGVLLYSYTGNIQFREGSSGGVQGYIIY